MFCLFASEAVLDVVDYTMFDAWPGVAFLYSCYALVSSLIMRHVYDLMLVKLRHGGHARSYVHRPLLRNVVDTQYFVGTQKQ